MSVKAIAAAWGVSLEPTQKFVLVALADHADDETWDCWPSLTHLAKKTGLGRSTVIRALGDMETKGVISRAQRGKRQTTVYHLNISDWSQSETSPRAGLVPERDQDSPRAGLEVVPERDPEPSVKPSKNRKSVDAHHFDAFWEAYPKKVGKKKCRQKWQAQNLDDQADKIIEDVRARAERDRQWADGYIPNPETYLNQERWEDEWESTSPKRRGVVV